MSTTISPRLIINDDSGVPAAPVGDGDTINNQVFQDLQDIIDGLLGDDLLIGGTISSEAFGTHLFSAGGTGANVIAVRNTTAGTGNQAAFHVGNDTSATALIVQALSSTYTGNNDLCQVIASIAGGMRFTCSHASGEMAFFTNSTRRLTISPAGVITPSNGTTIAAGFLARNSANDTSVTNGATVDFDTEVYDEGGNFATDTFTATVPGRYLLTAVVTLTNTSGGADSPFLGISTSNAMYYGQSAHALANNTAAKLSTTVIADMDAGDTASVSYFGAGATITGSDAGTPKIFETYFCGRLLL